MGQSSANGATKIAFFANSQHLTYSDCILFLDYLCYVYLSKTPSLVKPIAKNLVWSGSSREKVVYLTFDDGPIPEVTPFVLEILKSYGAKATFFMVGENVMRHPNLYRQVLSEGHAVGNHTHNHLEGFKTSTYVYAKNTLLANKLIHSPLFRPPYGRMTRNQSKCLRTRFTAIMWDVLSGDFDASIPSDKVLKNITNNVTNGSIVVMRDSLKAEHHLSVVLPKALDFLMKEGYELKALPMEYWQPGEDASPI